MTATDPAFPATFLGATVIIGPDAEFTANGVTDSTADPLLSISVRHGMSVVSLQFEPAQFLEFAVLVGQVAAYWTRCSVCGSAVHKAAAYTPDTGGPARWARTFCGGPCAEAWSERNDPAVTS